MAKRYFRPQISAFTLHDNEPVSIYYDAVDSYYPNHAHRDVTTVNMRGGVTHDIKVDYPKFHDYMVQGWEPQRHRDFTRDDDA